MVRVLTSHSVAASSGVIMPLGSVHLLQLFCGETNGRLMITTRRFTAPLPTLLRPFMSILSTSLLRNACPGIRIATPKIPPSTINHHDVSPDGGVTPFGFHLSPAL